MTTASEGPGSEASSEAVVMDGVPPVAVVRELAPKLVVGRVTMSWLASVPGSTSEVQALAASRSPMSIFSSPLLEGMFLPLSFSIPGNNLIAHSFGWTTSLFRHLPQ